VTARSPRPRAKKRPTPKDFHAERLSRGRTASPEAQRISAGNGEDDVKRAIGRRVRDLRQKRGLNVKQLADRAEVTSGMISQLERGQVAASVATLLRIASALGVGIGDFFEGGPSGGMVVRANERAIQEWPLIGVRDELVSSDPLGRLQVFWSRLEAGATSGPELLEHGSEAELVLVLNGAFDLMLGSERVRLEKGDAITFAGEIPHGFANPNDEPADLVWVITPVSY
jgi:transcriptional regulator with XRE-family HTH domain